MALNDVEQETKKPKIAADEEFTVWEDVPLHEVGKDQPVPMALEQTENEKSHMVII